MIAIIVILLTAYIVVPLVDMSFNERVRFPIKLVVYLVTFFYVLWLLFQGRLLA